MLKECCEVMEPFVADSDASATVIGPTPAVSVSAALSHPAPDVPLSGSGLTMNRFRTRMQALYLSEITPTGRCVAPTKIASFSSDAVATVTQAQPTSVVAKSWSTFNNDKPTESLASEVYKSHGASLLTWIGTE